MKNIFTLFISLISLNIAMAQWVQKESAPIGTNRHHPVNFVLDYKAYMVTGVNSSNTLLKDFYVYDPSSDSWTKKTDFPGLARGFAYGANYNGKGYLGFGVSSTAYLNDLWEYDATSDSWTQLTSCPCVGRRHPSFVATAGKIFVGLGDGSSGNLNDWWIYDIATDDWTQGPSLPALPRHHPYYFGIGDNVYTGFGHGGPTIFKDFYKFDIDNNSWTKLQDFPGEARVAGAQTAYNGKGYILGGDGSDHSNLDAGEFYEYDPTDDSWTQLPSYPGQGRWAAGAFMIGNIAYISAGETFSNVLHNDLWAYELPYAVGVSELKEAGESFSIYPNPVEDAINLPQSFNELGMFNVSIFNLSGKEVVNVKTNNREIDVANLDPQMYFVVIQDEEGQIYKSKFIKN